MIFILISTLILLQQNQQVASALSFDQIDIYRTILVSDQVRPLENMNLNDTLDPMPKGDDCLNGLGLEHPTDSSPKITAAEGRELHVRFVDPSAQEAIISNNDPGRNIRTPGDVDSAVDAAFKTGLTTFSVIRFNASHTTAALTVSFHCGGLCGNSKTLILKKIAGNCTISRRLSRRCAYTIN